MADAGELKQSNHRLSRETLDELEAIRVYHGLHTTSEALRFIIHQEQRRIKLQDTFPGNPGLAQESK